MNLKDRIEIIYPWKITVFQNIFDKDSLQKYTQEFHSIPWDELFEEESSWWSVYDHELIDIVGQNFGSKPDLMNFKYDTHKNTLQVPHKDSICYSKTFQIFLDNHDKALGGTILHGDIKAKESYELPLLSNSATLFENNSKSWHSVKQHGYERKSIVFRWNTLEN